ncbi:hypothetical protein KM043_012614 [Ampulex compressa]|nr:hypothetical protein KM043_012614 [Ampulex compressa]
MLPRFSSKALKIEFQDHGSSVLTPGRMINPANRPVSVPSSRAKATSDTALNLFGNHWKWKKKNCSRAWISEVKAVRMAEWPDKSGSYLTTINVAIQDYDSIMIQAPNHAALPHPRPVWKLHVGPALAGAKQMGGRGAPVSMVMAVQPDLFRSAYEIMYQDGSRAVEEKKEQWRGLTDVKTK